MKTIENSREHRDAIRRIDALMDLTSPSEGELAELELLATLVDSYERRHHENPDNTPVSAIKFRMAQLGLKQKDLVPYLGAASRVSEILNGRRELTLAMARKLHHGLNIPAASLLGPPDEEEAALDLPTANYPCREMYQRGWFGEHEESWSKLKHRAGEFLSGFFGGQAPALLPAFNRQSPGRKLESDPHALQVWRHRVRCLADTRELPAYERGAFDESFLRELAGFSAAPDGPLLAFEALQLRGIVCLTEAHFKKTYLDGAALLTGTGRPVIALTLRFDRIDNFWFTLFHELGHVLLHLDAERPEIIDTHLDKERGDEIEKEADRFALDHLIPPAHWPALRPLRAHQEIRRAATALGIHPAIIAGRLAREKEDYKAYARLLGQKKIKVLFASATSFPPHEVAGKTKIKL
ncbi:MAG: ImmA/IrrE family metallo-endopeptidase [Verrucomicrobiales bacterium]